MSRSKRKRYEKKSVAAKVASEREKERLKEVNANPLLEHRPEPPADAEVLSKHDYAAYLKARKAMVKSIGFVSNAVKKWKWTDDQAKVMLYDGARKAIRTTNMKAALRAWKSIYATIMNRPETGNMGMVWEPLVDFWNTQGWVGRKRTELIEEALAKSNIKTCEACGKTKAVRWSEKSRRGLCMYCRAIETKGMEVKVHEDSDRHGGETHAVEGSVASASA